MTLEGWIFMLSVWLAVGTLFVWSYYKILKEE